MVDDAGIVVPALDLPALRAGLEQLTTGEDGGRLGRRAAALARERFTVERCAHRHLALYERLRSAGAQA